MVVKIVKVLPTTSREYTDRQGQMQVFKSKGFIINAGEGNIYAEAVQETCTSLDNLDIHEGDCAFVQLQFNTRDYKTSKGDIRTANEVTIRQMMMI